MPLDEYRRKRDFATTPEPVPGDLVERSGRFTVQRHRATALHYDVRLEINGVLVSWAVPKGPTLDPDERRLAMRTEDHPIEYLPFEGVIPAGEYGAGDVIVWDWGTFEPDPEMPNPAAGLHRGEIKFVLHGDRLRGRYTIIRTDRDGDRERWLLIKKRDEFAVDGWDAEDHPTSVRSGRTNDEVRDGVAPRFDADPPRAAGEIDLSAAVAAPMPDFIPPMLATLATDPFDDPDWLFEVKWDGYRVEAAVDGGRVRLWTRRRQDAAAYFPDLAAAGGWLDAAEAIVDGEVVALDPAGRPRFSLLQDHTGIRTGRSSGGKRHSTPATIVYQAFDLLYIDGRSLLRVPLEERKRLLRDRLRPHPMVRFAGHVIGEGKAFFAAARAQELEGIVAKLRRSAYEPDRRSKAWLKLKLRSEQEVVVVGWLPGQGSHTDLGSLILAVHEGEDWIHAGQVGSGIDTRSRRELRQRLEDLERPTSPLAIDPKLPGARWAEPRIVVRVEFAEWTSDGVLRQAAYKGEDPGRDPRAVHRERATPTRSATAEAESTMTEPGAQVRSDELAELDALQRDGTWMVGGREIRVTNLDKVLFPGRDDGPPITKRDLLRYHVQVAPTLVPYLRDRGLTVQRYPNGVGQKGFWQKDLPSHAPDWVRRWTFHHRSEGPKEYPVVDSAATLAWLGQEAAIELHPWTSPTDAPERPSYALIDVDPGPATTWDEVLVIARLYRTALEHLGVRGHPKVTGKRGIQVWVGIAAGPTFDETRDWVEGLSRAVGASVPDLVSWEWAKDARGGRARLDFTQNALNKTLVAPYSTRPSAGAPVSMPITWDELDDPALRPDRWTLQDAIARITAVGDPFAGVLTDQQLLPPLG